MLDFRFSLASHHKLTWISFQYLFFFFHHSGNWGEYKFPFALKLQTNKTEENWRNHKKIYRCSCEHTKFIANKKLWFPQKWNHIQQVCAIFTREKRTKSKFFVLVVWFNHTFNEKATQSHSFYNQFRKCWVGQDQWNATFHNTMYCTMVMKL